MKWFWVSLGRYFDNRNKTALPEQKIHLTKVPKAFGEMNQQERRDFIEKMASEVLPNLTSKEYISNEEIGVSVSRARKSRFMFDVPILTDWLFYLFIFFFWLIGTAVFKLFNSLEESIPRLSVLFQVLWMRLLGY